MCVFNGLNNGHQGSGCASPIFGFGLGWLGLTGQVTLFIFLEYMDMKKERLHLTHPPPSSFFILISRSGRRLSEEKRKLSLSPKALKRPLPLRISQFKWSQAPWRTTAVFCITRVPIRVYTTHAHTPGLSSRLLSLFVCSIKISQRGLHACPRF